MMFLPVICAQRKPAVTWEENGAPADWCSLVNANRAACGWAVRISHTRGRWALIKSVYDGYIGSLDADILPEDILVPLRADTL